MVRTKADGCAATRKVVAARAPRKSLGSSNSASGSSSSGESPAGKGKFAGGNPVCVRPTPEWQKGIGGFLVKKTNDDKENVETEEAASGSSNHVECVEETSGASGSSKDD
ncbi:PCNA-associated factor-like [Gigantopelta aegis]|uniref:PCNA-associated factor-like n=1 Tax=Gigantopelta aegis TaxID=1735272 RepID=UPI001B88AF68|nr:PCNA-associated factor-like [Gigantopelta aegis]